VTARRLEEAKLILESARAAWVRAGRAIETLDAPPHFWGGSPTFEHDIAEARVALRRIRASASELVIAATGEAPA
jgi:hypothetical protein